jgi:LuxR family transcriptional regulator, quorum-sensing system regulator SolR
MPSWREDWLHRLTDSVVSEDQVFDALTDITKSMGFEYCSFGVRLPKLGGVPREHWATTYPLHWQDVYLSHGYMAIDPVIDTALHKPLPVVWTDDLFKTQPAFWEEARAHGVCHGWTMGMHGKGGEMGLISIARSAGPLSRSELDDVEARLIWLSHTANSAIAGLFSARSTPQSVTELTLREREVLCWTAAGKTSAEIGIILGISTRTVNFHITSILFKLDAVNKTQAVVKAVMLNLLS